MLVQVSLISLDDLLLTVSNNRTQDERACKMLNNM